MEGESGRDLGIFVVGLEFPMLRFLLGCMLHFR